VVRPWAHDRFSRFIGDVFVYLDKRGNRRRKGDIVKIVEDGFRRAVAARKPDDDQLVVVGHSMGGIVAYDLLSYYAPDIECDLFVTVGSQVGLFAELGLLRTLSDTGTGAAPSSPVPLIPRPPNIRRWLNVLDRTDVLAYAVQQVFADSRDFEFPTETHALASHCMYFYRPRFHRRLHARIQES
jgi:pimeloyl-ACP methyl ester carboxylesterase